MYTLENAESRQRHNPRYKTHQRFDGAEPESTATALEVAIDTSRGGKQDSTVTCSHQDPLGTDRI
jgi:hypothetical protein